MVITITLNPALDKTIMLDEWKYGGLNRIREIRYDAGGKGINVSRSLHKLGDKCVTLGFLAGNTGEKICECLEAEGICGEFIRTEGESRTNIKICEKNGTITELNEPGPIITRALMEKMKGLVDKYCTHGVLLVLSGSLPLGVNINIYQELIKTAHSKGAATLLDADGEAMKYAVEECPEIMKPNKGEIERYFNTENLSSDDKLIQAATDMCKNKNQFVAVSLGEKGALFIKGHKAVRCPAISVPVSSTVGAGDAMVAALAYSWEHKYNDEDTVRLAMACSAAAVTTQGTNPAEMDLVQELKQRVIMEERIVPL